MPDGIIGTDTSCFAQLVGAFAGQPEVEAILLAGSRGAGRADAASDYDVYVYLNAELPVDRRKAITDDWCRHMELDNRFWETEDDGVLKDGTDIELIYRDLGWFTAELSRVVEQHQAGLGYTTCYWANLLDSQILFDRHGRAAALQQRFRVPYPAPLRQAIVDKNFPLLCDQMPAYYFQLEKALKRHDLVSVHHRVTEFLASYFDILFAVNELPHPGEKRLLGILARDCKRQPVDAAQSVRRLLRQAGEASPELLATVKRMTRGMRQLLESEGLRV